MRKLQFCLVVFTLLALTAGAFAQVQNGQFEGTVTDPTGAAIANAKVTVTNIGTNFSVSLKTNASGLYVAKELPIGSYKLTAEAAGFKTTSNTNVVLNAGVIAHVDFKLQIGKATEVVEVTGASVTVQTDDAKLYSTVTSNVIENTVLSGRNVFDLMQLGAGAVNVAGTDFENGHNTVVNGVREDFNGFLINGVSNKGLSGGEESTPINDTVEEFQDLGLNMSAQYGNSAGSTINLVTKSGTNALHGSVFEYLRNDAADANEFFLNSVGAARPPYRWNQFGATLGGPIIKDKLFFFLAYQGSRFLTSQSQTITEESPDWRQAVAQADTNTGVTSVANLLYSNFAPALSGSTLFTMDQYIATESPNTTSLFASYADYLCPDSYTAGFGLPQATANAIAARMQSLLGVVPAVDNAVNLTYTGAPCGGGTYFNSSMSHGTVGRDATTGSSSMPFELQSAALFGSRNVGNFFNGNDYSARLDYNWNASNRISGTFNWHRQNDEFGPCSAACTRGFSNPQIIRSPNAQFSFVHTFSPTILNEFRAGYAQNVNLIGTNAPGVPYVLFDDTSAGFGSYNGYPQYFRENIYSYSDMVSITHGNHNMKIGADFRRNIENSQFSIARGSYYFSDPIFFAADSPYSVSAGVNPGICAPPCSQSTIQSLVSGGVAPSAALESNIRHWRNLEFGAYFQDDWKITKRLTLQLGLRYDLYTRHSEEANAATTFILGPGSNVVNQLISANSPPGTAGCDPNAGTPSGNPAQDSLATIAGVCGPGGFSPSA
ncbi:MAG TPA: carboxypeptidase regulatory-like domain-containing protein, partial [Verrucomicrobiae bacterium]|nr:carboxypeptidase regulatory-like domain-containing protein [Verrucomicrobiae bacterium]